MKSIDRDIEEFNEDTNFVHHTEYNVLGTHEAIESWEPE